MQSIKNSRKSSDLNFWWKKIHKNSKDSNLKNIEPLYCAEHSGEYV
jgi:hypothetical protein